MKTMFCAVSLAASLGLARAHDTRCDADLAYYQAAAVNYVMPVVYQAMAVYQTPVVYQAPVVYYGPVYYLTPPALPSCYPVREPVCEPRSTVVVIGAGRPYSYSNFGSRGSMVYTIGTGYSRWHR